MQPLVENAIKHGVAPSACRAATWRSWRGARRRRPGGLRLRVTVSNTGAPLSANYRRGGDHVGLDNVERRLAGHYGGAGFAHAVDG